jgi:photosystem II stability/assembly factor-like uncharacterized protein
MPENRRPPIVRLPRSATPFARLPRNLHPAFPAAFLAALPLVLGASLAAPLGAAVGSWTPLGPDGGGGIDLAADPSTPGILYAGMDGGVFRSFDGAASWTQAAGLPPGPMTVTVDPLDPAHLYAIHFPFAGGASFFFSGDRGATWSAGGAFGSPNTFIRAVAADPLHAGTVYAASFDSGLFFRSTDGGRSWQLRSTLHAVTSLAVGGDGAVYAGTVGPLGTFLVSTNGGATWVDKSGGLPRIGDFHGTVQVVLDPRAPGTIYLDAFRILSEPGNLFKSTDGGDSWAPLGNQGTPIAVAPDGTIYTGSRRSTDSGRTWTALAPFPLPHQDIIESLAFDPASPHTVYALTFVDGVFVSRDQGASWGPASRGLIASGIEDVAVDAVSPSLLYASTNGQGFYRGRASGRSWHQANPHLSGFLQLLVDPNQAGALYTTFPLQRSTDGGTSWQPLAAPPCPPDPRSLAVAPTSPTTLYLAAVNPGAGCFDCSLVRSTDGGARWSCISLGSPVAISSLLAAPSRPTTLYASDGFGLWKSGDSGAHWVRRRLLRPLPWTVLAVDPTNPDVVFIASSAALQKSTNGGRRWFLIGQDLPAVPFALQIDPHDARSLYAAVNADVTTFLYHSADGGSTWTLISQALPLFSGTFAIDLAHPNTVFAGTSFNGVQSYTLPAP